MKMMVVYQSSTGFTKTYAEWIGEELGCPVKAHNKVSPNEISQQDVVIYGGWIMGNMIMGLNKLKRSFNGRIILFAVGASASSNDVIQKIIKANNIEDEKFYYFEGGFRYEELGFFKKRMLNFVKKSIEKKTDKTEQDIEMANMLGTSFDNSDKKYIDPLVDYVKNVMWNV